MASTKSNSKTSPRLLAAYQSPFVAALVDAIRDCEKSSKAPGTRYDNAIAGRLRWAETAEALVMELKLAGVPDAKLCAIGETFSDGVFAIVSCYNPIERATLQQLHLHETIEEGEANVAQRQSEQLETPGTLMTAWRELHDQEMAIRRLKRGIRQRYFALTQRSA